MNKKSTMNSYDDVDTNEPERDRDLDRDFDLDREWDLESAALSWLRLRLWLIFFLCL